MTTVITNTTTNTVTVTAGGSTTVVEAPATSTVTATTSGPAGPAGVGFVLNSAAKVDKSVVYYDASSNSFKADTVHTTETLTDGGNF